MIFSFKNFNCPKLVLIACLSSLKIIDNCHCYFVVACYILKHNNFLLKKENIEMIFVSFCFQGHKLRVLISFRKQNRFFSSLNFSANVRLKFGLIFLFFLQSQNVWLVHKVIARLTPFQIFDDSFSTVFDKNATYALYVVDSHCIVKWSSLQLKIIFSTLIQIGWLNSFELTLSPIFKVGRKFVAKYSTISSFSIKTATCNDVLPEKRNLKKSQVAASCWNENEYNNLIIKHLNRYFSNMSISIKIYDNFSSPYLSRLINL